MTGRSSGMSRVMLRHFGLEIALLSHASSAGTPSSLYTPWEARSLIETRPITSSSCAFIGRSISLECNAHEARERSALVSMLSPLALLYHLVHELEERAKAFRRLIRLAFSQSVADQQTQLRRVG